MAKKQPDKFVGKVSKYGKNRKHIEIPKDKKSRFRPGDPVRVEKIGENYKAYD